MVLAQGGAPGSTSGIGHGGYCFARGTQVATANGSAPIERLQVGDEVQSYDFAASKVVTRRVTQTFAHEPTAVLSFNAPNGRHLLVTPNHPIYSNTAQGFIPAGAYRAADQVLALASLWSTSESSLLPSVESSGVTLKSAVIDVFDISVEGTHNFFAEGVLVHNKSPCTPTFRPDCYCQETCISGAGGPSVSLPNPSECMTAPMMLSDGGIRDICSADGEDGGHTTAENPDGAISDAAPVTPDGNAGDSSSDATLSDGAADGG